MNILQALILGLVQGTTEFIPISSSGHLVLIPWLFGWPEPGLAFDAVLHLGTLLAVLIAFRRDWWALAWAWVGSIRCRERSAEARLAWWIVIATIPAALMGLVLEKQFEALFSQPRSVALFLLLTGAWLWLAERLGRRERRAEDLQAWEAVAVGVAQGLAIAPGISRSGATIGAGMLLGLKREAAARFSFLLSAPVILGAGLLQVRKLLGVPNLAAEALPLALGFVVAAVTGVLCIRALLKYVQGGRMTLFAIYCWFVGLITLLLAVRG